MEVGREIRRIREAKGQSQTKVAADAGMSVSGLSQIETGARNPSAVTLAKLAEALDVEMADLFPKAQTPLQLELADQAGPADSRTGDERLNDRLAWRVARLEPLDLPELSKRRQALAEWLSDLKEKVPFKGGTIEEISDWPQYLEVMDETLALMAVLERKAEKQLAQQ